jgi:hypothetical protein
MEIVGDILNAWVHHYEWLWMLVGLTGWVVIVALSDN